MGPVSRQVVGLALVHDCHLQGASCPVCVLFHQLLKVLLQECSVVCCLIDIPDHL